MALLQIVAGLIFILLLFTLLASAIQELIANYISLRGVMLMKTIQHILGPQLKAKGNEIYQQFTSSLAFKQMCRPSSHSLYGKALDWIEEKMRVLLGYGSIGAAVEGPPSYISAENFAEVLKTIKWSPETLENLPEGPLRDYVTSLLQKGETKIDALKRWYDEVMNATTNWYRRQAQFILIFIGLALAGSFNIDLIRIAKTLSDNETLRTQLYSDMEKWMAERASTYFDENGQLIKGNLVQQNEKNIIIVDPNLKSDLRSFALTELVGHRPVVAHWYDWFSIVGSWLLTAIFISFGAPFWFDLLRKLVRVAKPV